MGYPWTLGFYVCKVGKITNILQTPEIRGEGYSFPIIQFG